MQGILGTTLTRPLFTVYHDRELKEYNIYLGLALLTTIPDDKRTLIFKMTIAMLVGAGVCVRHIQTTFKLSYETIQRYTNAARTSTTDEELLSKLKNPGRGTYKVTPEMADEIRGRAAYHASRGEFRFLKQTIIDIQEKFGVRLSAETIRAEIKKGGANPGRVPADVAARHCAGDGRAGDAEELPLPFAAANVPMRNSYAGLLLLSAPLALVFGDFPASKTADGMYDVRTLLVWWLVGVLVGASNLEGHRHFNIADFEFVTGHAGVPVVEKMRTMLRELSVVQATAIDTVLLRKNIDYFIKDENDFYLDGHFEEYTGQANILSGWSTIRNRALPGSTDYMVHDSAGNPVFSFIFDQFEDFREVIIKIIHKIKRLRPERKATMIYDRGGFSVELMRQITDEHDFHFITWQKGFERTEAAGLDFDERLTMEHPYNDLGNFKSYTISFAQDEWACKEYRCRRIVIRREDKNKDDEFFYQSILTSDRERDGAVIVARMLGRPLQENDFKKQKGHFGLDEITSYGKLDYGELNDKSPDRQARNREYDDKLKEIRAVKKERDRLFAKLGLGVYKESSLKNMPADVLEKHRAVVAEIKKHVDDVQLKKLELKNIKKEISKLAKCHAENRVELDLRPKRLMNLIKITARNVFEKSAREFLEIYKNLRDYQKVFRKLTRTGGVIELRGDVMHVQIDSFGRRGFKKKCNEYLALCVSGSCRLSI